MSRRVLAALLAASAVSLTLFALPLAELVQEYYRDQAIIALHQHVATALPKLIAAPNTVMEPNSDPDYQLGLYDQTGTRVGGAGPGRADGVVTAALAGTATSAVADAGGVTVAVPVTGVSPVAVVRGESPPSVIDAHVRRAWAAIIALGGAVFAVVGVGAWFLARRLVRPVQALTTDLARLGDGDFTISTSRTGVAEIDAAHDALTDTATRLGDTLERERAFSADVAHQLRTPITSLRLGLESELSAPRPDPTIALHEALEEIDRLETTTEDLLTLARSPAVDVASVDIDALLAEVGGRWQRRFEAAGRHLTIEPTRERVVVVAHAGRLTQAIDILIDNALQHGAGTTTVTATAGSDHVYLTVRDEGPGVTDVSRPPAGRDEPARRPIGLDLARRLVETEGGRLQTPTRAHPAAAIILLAADDGSTADAP